MRKSKIRRVRRDNSVKLAAIKEAKKTSISTASIKLGIPKTTIHDWVTSRRKVNNDDSILTENRRLKAILNSLVARGKIQPIDLVL